MQPDNEHQAVAQTRKRNQDKSFSPRWRHFHPQETLTMRNPFKDDVIFQVADEFNTPYQYKLPGNKISELPGGAVATLGLKEVVDRLIGESKTDAIRIWEPSVREKYESQVIIKVKAPPRRNVEGPQGIVNLASPDESDEDGPAAEEHEEETAFSDAQPQQQPQPPAPPQSSKKKRQLEEEEDDAAFARTAAAGSLGSDTQVIEED